MTLPAEISQRDLRLRSKDIMDAVELGQSFTVTRGGRPMGQLIPLRRRFVSRTQFALDSEHAATVNLEGFRAGQDAALQVALDDPYAR
jgi:antitoxin (DNA-binding transcriptional repressor) of toxin-antitoxin stability system